MPQRSVVAVGASLLVASLALAGCGTRDDSGSDASGSGAGEQGRQDRRHRAAVRRPVCPRPGHPELGRPGHQAGQRERSAIPGWTLELAAEDDEAKPDVGKNAATKLAVRQRRRRCRRHAELQRRAERRSRCSTPAKIVQVSPANTEPVADPGRRLRDRPEARRTRTTSAPAPPTSIQGPFAAELPVRGRRHQEGRDDPRQEDLRPGPGRRVHRGVQEARRQDRRGRDDQPRRRRTTTPSSRKIKPLDPEAVYYGGEYPQAGPLSQQMKAAGLNVPLMGGDGIFDPSTSSSPARPPRATSPPRSAPRPTTLPSAKDVRRRLQGGRLRRAVRGLRRLLLRRGQRHHQRAEGLARKDAELDAEAARAGDDRPRWARSPSPA